MDINKNQLAQDINIDNNPVNKDNDIIPEDNNNTDKDIEETIPTTPKPIITEEIKPIEEMNTTTMIDDQPMPPTPDPELEPVSAPRTKNTVRYIDGGFTF